MEPAMECPKCKHKIFLDLTLEEMVYCPYCDQRMVPSQESNACPNCGGALPIGSVYCLHCSNDLKLDKGPIIEEPLTQVPPQSHENVESPVSDESPALEQKPPELPVMPAPEAIPPQIVKEEPMSEEPAGITRVPAEHHTNIRMWNMPQNNEYRFCFVCGQKLLSGALYCHRCGKSTQVLKSSSAKTELPQPHNAWHNEEPVSQKSKNHPIVNQQPELRAVPHAGETPSNTNVETAPTPIPNVRPKYRPLPSREPISEAMEDKTPVMHPFPRSKALPRKPWNSVWPKIKSWLAKAIKQIKEGKSRANEPRRLAYLILGTIVIVALFIFIGVTMSRCI
jgi:hypothetical protein